MRRADAVIATARLSASVRIATDAAIVTAVSTDASVPTPAWTARSRSRAIHRSAACSRSNSLTCSSAWRALDSQWMRLIASPCTYGRTVLTSGVAASYRRRVRRRAVDRRWRQAPVRQRHDLGEDDDARRLPDDHLAREQPERVAGPHAQAPRADSCRVASASPSPATGGGRDPAGRRLAPGGSTAASTRSTARPTASRPSRGSRPGRRPGAPRRRACAG